MPMNLTFDEVRHLYPIDDGVHGLSHIKRVYGLATYIAEREGADIEIVQTAALLHDAQPLNEVAERKAHHLQSAQVAEGLLRSTGWTEVRINAVLLCIRAHRFRDEDEMPQTIEAKVLFDADKLDALGAVGIYRAVAYAVTAKQDLYQLPSEQFVQSGTLTSGEAHTPYHEYLLKLRHLPGRMMTNTGKSLARQRAKFMDAFFAQLVAELQEFENT